MPRFKYVAIGTGGKKIEGEVEAKDRASVASFLKREPITVISVTELKAQRALFSKKEAVKLGDLVIFSRQLSTLVKAGVPLVKGLGIISSQLENKTLRDIVNSLRVNIESGRSLSDSLANYPQVFSSIFINMVRAGETGGALDAVLDHTAEYLEKMNILNRKVRGALVYPAVVVVMTILIMAFLFIMVIPSFKNMFVSLAIEMPLPTRIIIGISEFFKGCYLYLAAALTGAFIVLKKYVNSKNGRAKFDKVILTVPVLGNLFVKVIVARFASTLSILSQSGISILQALKIVAKTAGNVAVENSIIDARARVSRGEKIGESLKAAGGEVVFSPLVVDMISVGEESGNLSPMLDKIADFYEREVDSAVAGLVALLEPVVIIFLGLIIGMIAVSLFLPIFKILETLGG